MLATQSIEARAQQEGCRQACTIGLSINEDTKLEKRKGEKEEGWCGGLIQISCEGRQGASGRRDNRRKQYHIIWNCTRQYKTVYAVTLFNAIKYRLTPLFFLNLLNISHTIG